jgi:putative glycosyltransferase (TIGR04348 family)
LGWDSHLRARIVKILIVTPEAPGSTLGNAVTANRWGGILRQLGHDVTLAMELKNTVHAVFDLLVALHARRSFPSIQRFRHTYPSRPLVLALTGTDLYRDVPAENPEALESLRLATRIVALQEAAIEGLPELVRNKVFVIYQSAVAPPNSRMPRNDFFEVCVLSHLRDVKDPLTPAQAARYLPPSSGLRVVHAGRALSPEWEAKAREEQRLNPRYIWLGDQPHNEAMQLLSGSRALILPSLMEGGASVIAEAVVCGIPVLCSRIAGNIGMLGREYRGYFRPRDTHELAEKLRLIEDQPAVMEGIRQHILTLQPRFAPETERDAWAELLAAL